MIEESSSAFRGSPQQEEQWRREPDGPSRRVQAIVRFHGGLDPDALKDALCRVVERHESLRTTFAHQPGMRIPLRGEGEAGAPGAPRGDLYCRIRVREHSVFNRDGTHLICQVPITISQAALGGNIEVPTLDGMATYPLKRGTQTGGRAGTSLRRANSDH